MVPRAHETVGVGAGADYADHFRGQLAPVDVVENVLKRGAAA